MDSCKIFISHSSEDKQIVDAFVKNILIGVFNLEHTEIFCTSLDGMGIETGDQWRDAIKQSLNDAKIVFLIITPNYKSSEICLNEMGAAWIVCDNVIPLIINPITFKQIGPLMNVTQGEDLNSETSLDRIKDKLHKILSIKHNKIRSDYWTTQKKEFIEKIRKQLRRKPFPAPISKDYLVKLENNNNDLKEKLDKSNELYKHEKLENEKHRLLIKKIKKLKDQKEVKELESNYNISDGVELEHEEFNKKVRELRKSFNYYDSVIRTLIYNDYTGNEIEIDIQSYSAEIKRAKANGIIDDDFNIIWNSNNKIKELYNILKQFKKYYEEQVSSGLFERLEEEYPDSSMEFNNLGFWKDIIGIKMTHN